MISHSEALILARPGVLLLWCHMRGSSLILNSWAGSTPACRRNSILSCSQATFLGHCRSGLNSLYTSLAKIMSDPTFEECRGHAYTLCMSIHTHVISKDTEKTIKNPSDNSRNCLSLKRREYLLYTYSPGGQYATQSGNSGHTFSSIWCCSCWFSFSFYFSVVSFSVISNDNAGAIVHPAGRQQLESSWNHF